MSASSGSTEREIDEYQDESPGSNGSYENSSKGNTSNSSDSSSQVEQRIPARSDNVFTIWITHPK